MFINYCFPLLFYMWSLRGLLYIYKCVISFVFGCKITQKTWNIQIFFSFSSFLFRKSPIWVKIMEKLAICEIEKSGRCFGLRDRGSIGRFWLG